MLTEIVPLINKQTGEIVDFKILRSFRLNNPKKKEDKKEQKPLQTTFEEEEKL